MSLEAGRAKDVEAGERLGLLIRIIAYLADKKIVLYCLDELAVVVTVVAKMVADRHVEGVPVDIK